jgi:hydrogenase nickel insertion protein HypA
VHEYSLVQDLVERVEGLARSHRASSVRRVCVRIGALAGVEPDLFVSAFEVCQLGTACAGATLEVARVEARWDCAACGTAVASGAILRCGVCGAPARLAAGDELTLDRVEMDVEDDA